jgi:hypothetical protein
MTVRNASVRGFGPASERCQASRLVREPPSEPGCFRSLTPEMTFSRLSEPAAAGSVERNGWRQRCKTHAKLCPRPCGREASRPGRVASDTQDPLTLAGEGVLSSAGSPKSPKAASVPTLDLDCGIRARPRASMVAAGATRRGISCTDDGAHFGGSVMRVTDRKLPSKTALLGWRGWPRTTMLDA